MSKELEALKDLRDVKGWNDEELNKRLDIIETALKRQDSIEITAIDIEQENQALCKENKKLKRALEIIRKLFESGYLNWEYGELRTCGTNNGVQFPLNKEECDLLKEVLKNE